MYLQSCVYSKVETRSRLLSRLLYIGYVRLNTRRGEGCKTQFLGFLRFHTSRSVQANVSMLIHEVDFAVPYEFPIFVGYVEYSI